MRQGISGACHDITPLSGYFHYQKSYEINKTANSLPQTNTGDNSSVVRHLCLLLMQINKGVVREYNRLGEGAIMAKYNAFSNGAEGENRTRTSEETGF